MKDLRKTVWRRATSLLVCIAMVATLAMTVSTNALGAGNFIVTRDVGSLTLDICNSLADAITVVNNADQLYGYTIEVLANEKLNKALTINAGVKVTIKSSSAGPFIIEQEASERHFLVGGTSTSSALCRLTLENITLNGMGRDSTYGAITNGGVQLNSGEFIMNTGATIQYCYNGITSGGGGGVYVTSLAVTKNFVMNGDSIICKNYSANNGGGVHIGGNCTFTMN